MSPGADAPDLGGEIPEIAGDEPEIGRDALDPATAPTPAWLAILPARRAALGLRATSTPWLAFIIVGIVLGPAVSGLLTAGTLARLDAVVSVALAALGVFVGLGIGRLRDPGQPRLVVASLLESAISIVAVGGVMYGLLRVWGVPLSTSLPFFALALGICACASAATRVPGNTAAAAHLSRVVDLDDLPLVALGAIAVAVAAGRPAGSSLALVVVTSTLVGAAGWLLFEYARSDAERGVFVVGAMMLLGGVGAYAGTSPLLSGCLAALLWVRAPGAADRIIASDLRKLQHPLVALLLIVAGASVAWTYTLLWIAAPLVLVRLLGKLLASAAIAGVVRVTPSLAATVLVPPGVLGIALALNIQQVLGFGNPLLLSSVTVATGLSELLPLVLWQDAEDKP
jgi:hypothetical protein